MIKASPWNDITIQLLRDLWGTHSSHQIASIFFERYGIRVTRNAVIGKLHRLGLTNSDKTEVHPSTRTSNGKPRSRAAKPINRPVLRISPAGNGMLRVYQSITAEQPGPIEAYGPSLGLTIEQLDKDRCRWIVGDSLSVDGARYCGANTPKGSSWCPFHKRIVFQPARERRAA